MLAACNPLAIRLGSTCDSLGETSTRSEPPGRLAGQLVETSTRSEPAVRLAGKPEETSTGSKPTGRPTFTSRPASRPAN